MILFGLGGSIDSDLGELSARGGGGEVFGVVFGVVFGGVFGFAVF
jgi:hypothetical protein